MGVAQTMTAKPRLLVIGPTPPPFHGVAVAIQTLLQSSITAEFQVCHVELADRRGIQHVNKPDLHDAFLFGRQWVRLVAMLFRSRPRLTYLVLSQTTIGFIRDSLLIWPAFLKGSHVVLHLHGGNIRDWFLSRSWLMKRYVRMVLNRVARVIVLGESLKGLFEGLVQEHKVAVVPNGVDWQSGNEDGEQVSVGNRHRILHLSTLSHLKGALVLLQAIPLVVKHHRNVEFVFAGPWSHMEDKEWAEKFIVEKGIAPFVSFTGQVEGDAKVSLFKSSHIFVFPGVQQEGQPLVVLEAMAAGLPVVFTNRGCLKETLGRESGLCTELNDPKDLAAQILWLLDHPEERTMMGQAGRRRYERFFTKEQHIASMTRVLKGVATATK
ncbi:glycosyltransferase family 4 protein [Nitrospira sp. Nam80]